MSDTSFSGRMNETELKLASFNRQLHEKIAALDRQLREKIASLDRQLRDQGSTIREHGTEMRTEFVARIDASESRLVNDVQDLLVRMLELKSDFAKSAVAIEEVKSSLEEAR